MTVAYTDVVKQIADRIKAIILAEIPRFKQAGRFFYRSEPKTTDFAKDDFIRLQYVNESLGLEESAGKIVYVGFKLHFCTREFIASPDVLTDMAAHLDALFGADGYRHDTYWHYLEISSIEYNVVEVPEGVEIGNYSGFVMDLVANRNKI